MNPSLKVIVIANACQWASWPQKIAAIKAFYAPLVELEIDIKYTSFPSIPTAEYPGLVTQFGPNGTTDVAGTDLEIDQTWFNENIGPMVAGYDIAVFQTTTPTGGGLPLGVKFENLGGTWCCETFVAEENFTYSLPELPRQTMGTNLGNSAEVIIEHEISHALYSISGQTDNTHKFFYANQFAHVLTDIVLPHMSANPLVALYQQLIATLRAEIAALQAKKSTADMNTTPQDTNPALAGFPLQIVAWANIIAREEGATPESNNPGNLKYSTLTASWGATKGREAADGGFLCQFQTGAAGMTALCNFLKLGCENELIAFHAPEARTLRGFTVVYAGNPPEGYIDSIIAGMGVPGDTQISTFLD